MNDFNAIEPEDGYHNDMLSSTTTEKNDFSPLERRMNHRSMGVGMPLVTYTDTELEEIKIGR